MKFPVMATGLRSKVKRWPDCTCHTCDKDIHHLGIMSHRAMHRRRQENCEITFSDGRTVTYAFEKSPL
jgi:hypothetical protein